MAKYKVLSTKKLDPSLVKEAEQSGIEIIEQEFISVKPLNLSNRLEDLIAIAKAGFSHLVFVFTSQNAVFMFDKMRYTENASWGFAAEIFCLSGKTRDALMKSGAQISATADTSTSLAQIIIERDVKEVVFFCGNKRRDELPSILKQAGVVVHELVLYETIETPDVAAENLDGVLFFSPSAVQSFFSMNQLEEKTVCFAIGKTTAKSIADFTRNKIIVSESPSQDKMLAAVNRSFQNFNCY